MPRIPKPRLIVPAAYARPVHKYQPWLILYQEPEGQPPVFFVGHSSGIDRYLKLEKEKYLVIIGHVNSKEEARESAKTLNDKIPGRKAAREAYLNQAKRKHNG